MKNNEIRQTVINALVEIAPEIETNNLDPAVNFRDQAEIDSVDFLNFVLTLEKKISVKIPEMDYPKLSSLNGCVSYLADKS